MGKLDKELLGVVDETVAQVDDAGPGCSWSQFKVLFVAVVAD